MPNYIFDVNEGDSDDWDDGDMECEGRFAIERHARKLLNEAGARQAARGSETLPATVVVYQEDGRIIVSVHGWLGGTVRVLWAQEQQRHHTVREHVQGVTITLVHHTSETEPEVAPEICTDGLSGFSA